MEDSCIFLLLLLFFFFWPFLGLLNKAFFPRVGSQGSMSGQWLSLLAGGQEGCSSRKGCRDPGNRTRLLASMKRMSGEEVVAVSQHESSRSNENED